MFLILCFRTSTTRELSKSMYFIPIRCRFQKCAATCITELDKNKNDTEIVSNYVNNTEPTKRGVQGLLDNGCK